MSLGTAQQKSQAVQRLWEYRTAQRSRGFSDTFGLGSAQNVEQSSYSVNIGLPSHSIPSCRHWPAYVTHTSPVVKMLVEQDKLRKAGPQGTSEDCRQRTGSSKKRWVCTPSSASQEADFTGTAQVLSRPREDNSPLRIAKESTANTEGLFFHSNSSYLPITGNRVIFSRKPPFHVLPDRSQMSSSKAKSTALS
ncbi:CMT1A duplicated region transcript 4 protein homolog isoform X4 [Alligator sinensis]|uniref:CMT1A duplicated region transcript 4 protein homolog isoform X4 n=1 Tax=Alligator sinensis TaxID=38654 RepID=A0A3Q0HAH9_ALLSI|nr:CMT1A duplicated region transcript 4 protein homolog isoform X4 [Alligator sinensis]